MLRSCRTWSCAHHIFPLLAVRNPSPAQPSSPLPTRCTLPPPPSSSYLASLPCPSRFPRLAPLVLRQAKLDHEQGKVRAWGICLGSKVCVLGACLGSTLYHHVRTLGAARGFQGLGRRLASTASLTPAVLGTGLAVRSAEDKGPWLAAPCPNASSTHLHVGRKVQGAGSTTDSPPPACANRP